MKPREETLDYAHHQPLRGAAWLCPVCGKRVNAAICAEDGARTIRLPDHSSSDLYVGRVVNERYRVEQPIGQGAGQVYLGTQVSLGQRVAIKFLTKDRGADQQAVMRFHRGSRATTRLSGQHVVRVYAYEVDSATSLPFLVMEFLNGRTLASLLRDEGALSPRRAAAIAAQVARALVEAEERSIIHRDLKPENVFLVRAHDQADFVKVMGFGLARTVPGLPDELGSVTLGGEIVGTPAYMSPEQVTGRPVDTRSDLYGLGCLLHEMLTGAQPYASSGEGVARMVAHVSQPPPVLPESTPKGEPIPGSIRAVHDALLRKASHERPQSAAAVLEMLVACAAAPLGRPSAIPRPQAAPPPESPWAGEPASEPTDLGATTRSPWRRSWVAACAVLVLGVGALWAWRRADDSPRSGVTNPAEVSLAPAAGSEPAAPGPALGALSPDGGSGTHAAGQQAAVLHGATSPQRGGIPGKGDPSLVRRLEQEPERWGRRPDARPPTVTAAAPLRPPRATRPARRVPEVKVRPEPKPARPLRPPPREDPW